MKPFLITVLILVAIAAAAATLNKYERRPMNYFGKVSIIFSVFCSFSVSFSMIFLNLTLFLSAGELQKQIHGLHNESWGNKLNVLLPVVDRNERRNPLDHFNEEICKNSLSPSPSLSLFTEKVQAWSLQSWWYLLWWKMVNTVMNFAFFYTSGTTLALDHPTRSALVTIRTWIIYLNKSINSFPKKRASSRYDLHYFPCKTSFFNWLVVTKLKKMIFPQVRFIWSFMYSVIYGINYLSLSFFHFLLILLLIYFTC